MIVRLHLPTPPPDLFTTPFDLFLYWFLVLLAGFFVVCMAVAGVFLLLLCGSAVCYAVWHHPLPTLILSALTMAGSLIAMRIIRHLEP